MLEIKDVRKQLSAAQDTIINLVNKLSCLEISKAPTNSMTMAENKRLKRENKLLKIAYEDLKESVRLAKI